MPARNKSLIFDYFVTGLTIHAPPLDGGGYQGISNLLILGNLMKAIAEKRGLDSQALRPCDVFDVICGVGSGGWIALLLGRLMLSVSECHYEYCNIAKAIIRPDTATSKWSCHIHHSVYDMKRLKAYVRHLTQKYKTGTYLLAAGKGDVRCTQTFVVGSYQANGQLQHCLFRTYSVEDQGVSPDPAKTPISDAFSATGAKRGFLYPCKLKVGGGTTIKFGNETFPNCLTNATVIALNETVSIYGEHANISAVVNIGPGVPREEDIDKISAMVSRRISWGSTSSKSSKRSKNSKSSKGSNSSSSSGGSSWRMIDCLCRNPESVKGNSTPERISSPDDAVSDNLSPNKHDSPDPTPAIHHRRSLLCCTDRPEPTEVRQQLKTKQSFDRTEAGNRAKQIDGTAVYVHLGPKDAPENIVINDVLGMSPEKAQETAEKYLEGGEVREAIANLARRIPDVMENVDKDTAQERQGEDCTAM